MFYENKREILDEILFPQYFSREMLLIFTFETFEIGIVDRLADKTVTYEVEQTRFNTYVYPEIRSSLAIDVEVKGVYIPGRTSPIVELGLKTVKKFMNTFGLLQSDLEVEEIRFGKTSPQGIYAYTTDKPALFTYNVPVFFMFAFTRFHTVEIGRDISWIIGRLNNKELFRIDIKLDPSNNEWVALFNSLAKTVLA